MRILGLHFSSVENVNGTLLKAAFSSETALDNEVILTILILLTMKMEHLSSVFDFFLSVVYFSL